MTQPIRLALTMGDPCGIGPEIIAKATRAMRDQLGAGRLEFIVLGSPQALAKVEGELGLAPAAGELPPSRLIDVGPLDAPLVTGSI